ncbi:MAG: rhodanese-like domain-containing protein [Candidatus Eremiobacteraeota bacterium]|nr:rhodanese-like domain-containing protein [Candidatus Eremiobacteraeota bacterium]
MEEISVEELAIWRKDSKPFILLDVREPHEIATASISGATCIPMAEIPVRASELERTANIAVMCHHGGRSAHIAQLLGMMGFDHVYNVDGGINAYSERIDSNIPTY